MFSNTRNFNNDSGLSSANLFEKDSGISNDIVESTIEFKIPDESANGLRTHALWNFCKFTNGPRQLNLEALPIETQENTIMTEILYVLVGMRGTYIEPDDNEPAEGEFNLSFKISESISPGLRELIENILPLASHYICIQKFVEKAQNDDAGAVLQALSSSLDDVIHDYYHIIAQMEVNQIDSGLSLQKLHFMLRPTLQTIAAVADLLVQIMQQNLRGGAVLTLLYNAMDTLLVDQHLQSFVGVLLKHAAIPYIRTLELWLQKGVIFDPSQEFLIEDLEQSGSQVLPDPNTSLYWDQRYKIRSERIPHFLKDLASKIMKTGKYLNVVFKCRKETKLKKIKLDFEPSKQDKFLQLINDAYIFASRTLLKVISQDNDLMSHLWSVKHYLLLNQGDFIMKFLDTCDEELSKTSTEISSMKVYNLIQMILRVSSLYDDPHKDLLHCKLCTTDLNTQVRIIMGKLTLDELNLIDVDTSWKLTGYQSIAFDYIAPWPISLIMNNFIIGQYQLIFRLLFYCKYVENELCKTWKSCHKRNPEASIIRYQLLSTIQNFGYYITVDVIEPNWLTFIEQVGKAEDFDNFVELHDKFVEDVLKNILISYMTYSIDDMIKIFNICLEFCKIMQDDSQQQTELFKTNINNLGLNFRNFVTTFLSHIRKTYPPHQISTLANRINFNQFYSEKIQLEESRDLIKESQT